MTIIRKKKRIQLVGDGKVFLKNIMHAYDILEVSCMEGEYFKRFIDILHLFFINPSTGSQSNTTNFTCSNNEIKGQNGEEFSLENFECEAKDQVNRTFSRTTSTSVSTITTTLSTTTTAAAKSTKSRPTTLIEKSSTTTKSGSITEEKNTKEETKWSSWSTTKSMSDRGENLEHTDKSESDSEDPYAPKFFNGRGKKNNEVTLV